VITEQFVKDMLQEFKEQRLIHKRFAFQILLQVRGLASGALHTAFALARGLHAGRGGAYGWLADSNSFLHAYTVHRCLSILLSWATGVPFPIKLELQSTVVC